MSVLIPEWFEQCSNEENTPSPVLEPTWKEGTQAKGRNGGKE